MMARPVRFHARSKYHAVKAMVDGFTFASKAEARRYSELKMLANAGAIQRLQMQPVFPLIVNGVRVGKYIGDYQYYLPDGELVVEDCKGWPTPVYRLKKRIVAAQYGIQIREVK
jgi:hypothetical protein